MFLIRRHMFYTISVCMSILLLTYFMNLTFTNSKYNRLFQKRTVKTNTEPVSHSEIVIALVICGDRLQEALTLIKSAIVFQMNNTLRFVVLADDPLIPDVQKKLHQWQQVKNNSFQFEVHHLQFPPNKVKQWKSFFKECATQRLFLPDVLNHIDSILYVDTDTLFLAPVHEVWQHFSKMNETQYAALAPESEDSNSGWYSRFARHPYYGQNGVNSGVMLLNLTRMRTYGWTKYLEPIFKEYKNKLPWGDQDIINIVFSYHPENLYIYPCRYNYRTDHCRYMRVCKSALEKGVLVVHGSRSTFHNHKQPAFSTIHQAFVEYDLSQDPYQYLLMPLEDYLADTVTTNCGADWNIYVKIMRQVILPPKDSYFYKHHS